MKPRLACWLTLRRLAAPWLFSGLLAGGAALLAGSGSDVLAQPPAAPNALPTPQVLAIFPLGGKQGTEVEVKITSGLDLERVDRLLFSHPGIKAVQKLGDPPPYGGTAQPVENTFRVTIAANVPPGVYDVRAAGFYGISNPRWFAVSQSEELIESTDNNRFDKAMIIPLEGIVNGVANAANADYYRFSAKQGQRVLVDVWAQRVDSRMNASLVLYDASGREVARNRNMNRRDPMVDLAVPADGDYVVAVYDFLYEGGPELGYRLHVHTGPYIDFVVPSVGQPGSKGQYTIYGRNLPGGSPAAGVAVSGRPLEMAKVTIDLPAGDAAVNLPPSTLVTSNESLLDGFVYRLPSPKGLSNPVIIGYASGPVTLEQEPNNEPTKAQKIQVPCEFLGQFNTPADEDWIEFEAPPGKVFQVEIISQRLGLPTDPNVLIQRITVNKEGMEQAVDVAEVDDDPIDSGVAAYPTLSGDAQYRLTIANEGKYRMLIRDLHGSVGDPRRLYRLSIREPKPDFRLSAIAAYPTAVKEARPWSAVLRRGGMLAIDVIVGRRDGFNEEIVVSAEGLPPGVTCAPAIIGPDQYSIPLVLVATEDVKDWQGTIRFSGKAQIGNQTVTRSARIGTTQFVVPVAQNNQTARPIDTRLTTELPLSIVGHETLPVLITLGDGKPVETSRAGKIEIPVKVVRREGFKEALTLTPLGMPTIFKPANVTIAANANEGKLTLEVPGNAPLGTFSVYLKGPAKVSYRRDPQGADLAAEEKKVVDKLAADLTTASQAAEKAKQQAEQAAKDAAAELAKAPAEKKPEFEAKVKTANEAKVKAEEAAKEAAAKLKAATDAKAAAEKRATDMANAAKPKDVTIVLASTVGSVKVDASPVEVKIPTAPSVVKKEKTADVSVPFDRKFAFADPVEFEVVVPGEAKGLSAKVTNAAKGENAGKITFTATKEAAAGTFNITVRAKPRFNNQQLTTEHVLAVKVED